MPHRILLVLALLPLLLGCGGGDTFTPFGPDLSALDADGDGVLRFPYGPDLDDDGDGALTYLAGGSDYDDTSAAVQANGGTGAFTTAAVTYPAGDTPRAAARSRASGDRSVPSTVTPPPAMRAAMAPPMLPSPTKPRGSPGDAVSLPLSLMFGSILL